LTLASLLQQVVHEATEQFQQAAMLPDDVRFNFDPGREAPAPEAASTEARRSDTVPLDTTIATPSTPTSPSLAPKGRVLKTTQRTVVSLNHGRFQAHETVRQHTTAEGQQITQHSTELGQLVPRGGSYAFDLIAHVGVETFLHGRSLEDVQQSLAERRPAIHVALSSLWDQQQRFLFCLGQLHERSAPVIRAFLAGQPHVTWLLDGTLEPDTPVFLGVQDAASGLILHGWKISSENADDIAACLTPAAERYGRPAGVMHDLSPAMSGACDLALPGVPHRVCHFHLARDVGNDLCAAPQIALTKRHRSLKILARLREQRRGQTEWLRDRLGQPESELVLNRLLAGESLESVPFHATLSHEVLLAFHFWINDYRTDGRRRGFPFDPYTLYLHRRLCRASEAVDRLLSLPEVQRQAPPVLGNFRKLLTEYRTDAEIVTAVSAYERAYAMFGRLRAALRLSSDEMCNLRQPYDLPESEREPLRTAMHDLRADLRREVEQAGGQASPSTEHCRLARTVLAHLDKYWEHLVPESGVGPSWTRTTNRLESNWGQCKRGRRQSHGRGKLTRDFQSLPAEYLLVSNLENAQYVNLILGGNLDSLPSKLAAASVGGETFAKWRNNHRAGLLGRPCRAALRSHVLLDKLIQISATHSEPDDARAA
jgi:hypothetical protein